MSEARDAEKDAANGTQDAVRSSDGAFDESVLESPTHTDDPVQVMLREERERVLRLQAEMENARKRYQRELQDELRYANLHLVRDLLTVGDNLTRALEAAEKAADASPLANGVKMVAKDFEQVLQRYHCVKIDAVGQPFDTAFHQAVGQQPSTEHPPHTVLQVVQAGYRLHDRVVRPALVIVSAG